MTEVLKAQSHSECVYFVSRLSDEAIRLYLYAASVFFIRHQERGVLCAQGRNDVSLYSCCHSTGDAGENGRMLKGDKSKQMRSFKIERPQNAVCVLLYNRTQFR